MSVRDSDIHDSELDEATFRLRSWAFHTAMASRDPEAQSKSDWGVYTWVKMQKHDYTKASQILDRVIQENPVQLVLGENPYRIHDPNAYPWWDKGDDELEAMYGDMTIAAEVFYRKRITLEGGSSIVLDRTANILAPGDPCPFPYIGSTALDCYIQVDDLARILHMGGTLLEVGQGA